MASSFSSGFGAEVEGITSVRVKKYKSICNILKDKFPFHLNILDVGCAHGLFLKIAQNNGFEVVGLEPDHVNASKAREQGFEIIEGFFPDTEQLAGRVFDVVIFNDSFEHIPDLTRVIQGIRQYLKREGIVVINIPSSSGIIFRLSLLLSKLGIVSLLDRLWQKGFTSPHLHYFNPENLRMLFAEQGFEKKHCAPLRCYTLEGLWKRIRYNVPFVKSLFIWVGLTLFYPIHLLWKSKSDIMVLFFRK
jgi:2-polyprenyl-3-methyl-5-hydroxy-6-metoxy-1,4-benzoquinol methylase